MARIAVTGMVDSPGCRASPTPSARTQPAPDRSDSLHALWTRSVPSQELSAPNHEKMLLNSPDPQRGSRGPIAASPRLCSRITAAPSENPSRLAPQSPTTSLTRALRFPSAPLPPPGATASLLPVLFASPRILAHKKTADVPAASMRTHACLISQSPRVIFACFCSVPSAPLR